ncbi:Glu/Leu/Phe/Val family dehydrogenase [Nitriliruptor alkaliphilus]|uniref:Glu/Leu/Phe/Val family dehydrogenase n=1 Tax=Nitriliruptor alkaliphilus TaxID=427918 RepID=UPI0006989ABB|nr:Glu/Leu/Phe/Val dehydrogenase [Nitriliruptor alkaliphilus]
MTIDLHRLALDAIDAAADELDLGTWLRAMLHQPERSLAVQVPFIGDDGSIRVVPGYRIAHSTARGPAKGGTRFHPDVTPEEVAGLATLMSVKTAVMDLPLGGGKGGVTVDPKAMSELELESLTRSYARAIATNIGPDTDVPAPDVNTSERHMDWMADEYARVVGAPAPAVVTGKSLAAGGSLGRDTATAAGCRAVIAASARRLGLRSDARVVIQGFGNAGAHLAQLLAADGLRIVGLSDSRGAIHDPAGLDVAAVAATKAAHGSVIHHDAEHVSTTDLLALDCEILVPAALEGAIDAAEADAVRARLIAEAANGPCTPAADAILAERGVTTIPDVLASAGGVTVSCFEWEQNRRGERWTADAVASRLEVRMARALDDVWQVAEARRLPLRTAATVLGVDRIATALEARAGLGADELAS